jgi:hypothetical protein
VRAGEEWLFEVARREYNGDPVRAGDIATANNLHIGKRLTTRHGAAAPVSLTGEELVIDGQAIDPNITGSLTAAGMVRRYRRREQPEPHGLRPRHGAPRRQAPTARARSAPASKPSKGQKPSSPPPHGTASARCASASTASRFRLAGGGFTLQRHHLRNVTLSFEDELARS